MRNTRCPKAWRKPLDQGSRLREPPSPSASIEQRATEQIDGDLVIVVSGVAEAGQIGLAFVLPGGVQRAQADHRIAQGR